MAAVLLKKEILWPVLIFLSLFLVWNASGVLSLILTPESRSQNKEVQDKAKKKLLEMAASYSPVSALIVQS